MHTCTHMIHHAQKHAQELTYAHSHNILRIQIHTVVVYGFMHPCIHPSCLHTCNLIQYNRTYNTIPYNIWQNETIPDHTYGYLYIHILVCRPTFVPYIPYLPYLRTYKHLHIFAWSCMQVFMKASIPSIPTCAELLGIFASGRPGSMFWMYGKRYFFNFGHTYVHCPHILVLKVIFTATWNAAVRSFLETTRSCETCEVSERYFGISKTPTFWLHKSHEPRSIKVTVEGGCRLVGASVQMSGDIQRPDDGWVMTTCPKSSSSSMPAQITYKL